MSILSDKEINEIDSLLKKIGPAPWRSFVEGRDFHGGSNCITLGEGDDRREDIELLGATQYDQDFIAICRQLVPKLVAEIRTLRSRS